MKKTIILTGGGSAGHVTPNIALIPYLLKDGWKIHYIGSENGIEKQLISPIKGVGYHAIKSGKLRRYFSFKNFSDPFRVGVGFFQARNLIKRIAPDVIFAKGGFVSVPVVFAAKSANVPVVLHESDYTCGLANRLCAPRAKVVCVSFEPTLKQIKGNKGVWTGSPIRQEISKGSKEKAQLFCRFENPELPWVVFMGGSLGAAAINKAVTECIDELCTKYNVVHIRGKGKLDPSLKNKKNYRQYEFLSSEIPDIFAAASLMVCRSGANTLFELLATGTPSLLIPLPLKNSRGDQLLNAKHFENCGYSRVLMQEDLTKQRLLNEISNTLKVSASMRRKILRSPVKDGTINVLKQIYQTAGLEYK